MSNFFKNKRVLVTGSTGMIGISLINLLLKKAVKSITSVSLENFNPSDSRVKHCKLDLRYFSQCMKVCEDIDIVFHLAGIKGSPAMTKKQPASFFVPTLMFSVNMMEAARRSKVKHYLYTSSVGVYSPAEVFYEEDVWKTFPSENDKFAGWAKRMGELQSECFQIEYNWNEISIVRPANVYGPNDNFDPKNSMVIPSLIKKTFDSKDSLEVWGDGSPIRDFIFTDDVARGMIFVVENSIKEPLNLGSGVGYKIKDLVEIIIKYSGKKLDIVWLKDMPQGDKKRILSMTKASSLGFKPIIGLEEGINLTIDWYKKNKSNLGVRYNSFKEEF